jgi:hypothetical protein
METIVSAGALHALSHLLKSDSGGVRTHAARLLGLLATVPAFRSKIVAVNVIPSLVHMLELGPGEEFEFAAEALGNLATSPEIQPVILATKAVPLLIAQLGITGGRRVAYALSVLALSDLSVPPRGDIAAAVTERLPQLLEMSPIDTKMASQSRAIDNGLAKIIVVAEAAQLVAETLWYGAEDERDRAARMMPLLQPHLPFAGQQTSDAIAFASLKLVLTNGTASAKEHAAGLIERLATDADKHPWILTAGAVPLLKPLLAHGTYKAKEYAMEAIEVIYRARLTWWLGWPTLVLMMVLMSIAVPVLPRLVGNNDYLELGVFLPAAIVITLRFTLLWQIDDSAVYGVGLCVAHWLLFLYLPLLALVGTMPVLVACVVKGGRYQYYLNFNFLVLTSCGLAVLATLSTLLHWKYVTGA